MCLCLISPAQAGGWLELLEKAAKSTRPGLVVVVSQIDISTSALQQILPAVPQARAVICCVPSVKHVDREKLGSRCCLRGVRLRKSSDVLRLAQWLQEERGRDESLWLVGPPGSACGVVALKVVQLYNALAFASPWDTGLVLSCCCHPPVGHATRKLCYTLAGHGFTAAELWAQPDVSIRMKTWAAELSRFCCLANFQPTPSTVTTLAARPEISALEEANQSGQEKASKDTEKCGDGSVAVLVAVATPQAANSLEAGKCPAKLPEVVLDVAQQMDAVADAVHRLLIEATAGGLELIAIRDIHLRRCTAEAFVNAGYSDHHYVKSCPGKHSLCYQLVQTVAGSDSTDHSPVAFIAVEVDCWQQVPHWPSGPDPPRLGSWWTAVFNVATVARLVVVPGMRGKGAMQLLLSCLGAAYAAAGLLMRITTRNAAAHKSFLKSTDLLKYDGLGPPVEDKGVELAAANPTAAAAAEKKGGCGGKQGSRRKARGAKQHVGWTHWYIGRARGQKRRRDDDNQAS